jgi:hypothetical protein
MVHILRACDATSTLEPDNPCRFFDDVELLRQRWQSANTDSVGQLCVTFCHPVVIVVPELSSVRPD